jgi:transposase
MARAYGEDLRGRVIAAVVSGMSRRAAAARFEVGVSTAILWVRAWFAEGRRTAKPKGGDTHSHRIEAHAPAILDAIAATPDITLTELARILKQEHGASFARSTVHRFCVRHRLTLKKRRRTLPNRTAPTWPSSGRLGSTRSPTLTPSN